MAQKRRFRGTGGAGREDDQAGVPLSDKAAGFLHTARNEIEEINLLDVLYEISNSHGAFHDQVGLFLELHPMPDIGAGRHHLPDEGTEIGDRRLSQEEKGLRLHLLHADDEFLGL